MALHPLPEHILEDGRRALVRHVFAHFLPRTDINAEVAALKMQIGAELTREYERQGYTAAHPARLLGVKPKCFDLVLSGLGDSIEWAVIAAAVIGYRPRVTFEPIEPGTIRYDLLAILSRVAPGHMKRMRGRVLATMKRRQMLEWKASQRTTHVTKYVTDWRNGTTRHPPSKTPRSSGGA